jgi:acetyl-CoA acetyltransferase
VFEVHDCFSIAEVLMYEALGLADHGKGTHFAADGHTRTLPAFAIFVVPVAHPR